MNKANNTQKIVFFFCVMIIFSTLLYMTLTSFSIFEIGKNDPGDIGSFNEFGNYKINTQTILSSIDQGETALFLPDTTAFNEVNSKKNIYWKQSDYLKIATEFFDFRWNDSLNNWSMHKMFFDTECKEHPNGFDRATLIFYKPIFLDRKFSYDARAIDISSTDGFLSWGDSTIVSRPIFGKKAIELDKIIITADEALRIAEDNGGRLARQSLMNQCDLYLVFYEDWTVVYADKNGLPMLKISIDSYTGEVSITHQK